MAIGIDENKLIKGIMAKCLNCKTENPNPNKTWNRVYSR
jgi:hypothetical protein